MPEQQQAQAPSDPTVLHIKNMVCARCVRVVRQTLEDLGVPVQAVQLGRVQTPLPPTQLDLPAIRRALELEGFELLEDERARLLERIKAEVIALVQDDGLPRLRTNLSDHLAARLGRDYGTLSSLFSSLEGITLERYAILQKIERAKELLVYGEQTVSEIAYRLGYSSGAHLTNQFRRETGFSPTAYRRQKHHHRRPLDQVTRPSAGGKPGPKPR